MPPESYFATSNPSSETTCSNAPITLSWSAGRFTRPYNVMAGQRHRPAKRPVSVAADYRAQLSQRLWRDYCAQRSFPNCSGRGPPY